MHGSSAPSPPTRIHLVRHGTTMLNRANRYRGRRDVPLDRGGWDDAWTAATRLAEVGLDAVYTSPLRRARDTARIVADAAGIDVVTDLPGLVNLDYGKWEGLTADEARECDPGGGVRVEQVVGTGLTGQAAPTIGSVASACADREVRAVPALTPVVVQVEEVRALRPLRGRHHRDHVRVLRERPEQRGRPAPLRPDDQEVGKGPPPARRRAPGPRRPSCGASHGARDCGRHARGHAG